MKKMQIFILAVLTILLVISGTMCVWQVQRTTKTSREIEKLKTEVKELKVSVAGREEENQKLEEEKETAKAELVKIEEEKVKEEKIQKEEASQEAEQKPEKKEGSKNGKKVAIDPGHQGYNVDMSATEPLGPGSSEMKAKASTGTQGRFTGVPEYELNLNISKQLREELEKRGYEVLLTREDNDTGISNKERAILAADFGADIYVRIHANGSDNSGVNGAMTMVPSANNPFVPQLHEKSYALGEAMINAYCESCGIKNNGVQLFDNMTGINWSKVPVVILEMGFMTNEGDDRNMQDGDFQALMVSGIANGVDNYFAAGN